MKIINESLEKSFKEVFSNESLFENEIFIINTPIFKNFDFNNSFYELTACITLQK